MADSIILFALAALFGVLLVAMVAAWFSDPLPVWRDIDRDATACEWPGDDMDTDDVPADLIEAAAKSPGEWKRERTDKLMKEIQRYAEEYAKEIERTNSRNQWIRQLYASLDTAAG